MPRHDEDFTKRVDSKQLLLAAQENSTPVGATLTCLSGPQQGSVYTLRQGINIIGRSDAAVVRVRAQGVSRKHAKIIATNGSYVLSDLGSTNGTICRGNVIEAPVVLEHGDRVVVGTGVVLRFSLIDALEARATNTLFEQAIRDGLTSTYNRRHFEERLDSMWPRVARRQRCCAVTMFDLDHFKQVNDTYGHAAGDFVLREFVKVTRAVLNDKDLFARYGGEEFIVLRRDVESSDATDLAEKIRRAVESHDFMWRESPIKVTVSAGVACSTEGRIRTTDALIDLADRRLYVAKRSGRNRVVATGAEPSRSVTLAEHTETRARPGGEAARQRPASSDSAPRGPQGAGVSGEYAGAVPCDAGDVHKGVG